VLVHSVNTAGLWSPPYLVGTGASIINVLIGIGILLTVHQIPNSVKGAFGIRGLGLNPLEPLGAREPVTDITGTITRSRFGQAFNIGQPAKGPLSWLDPKLYQLGGLVTRVRGWYR
jgi:hypothetical protein